MPPVVEVAVRTLRVIGCIAAATGALAFAGDAAAGPAWLAPATVTAPAAAVVGINADFPPVVVAAGAPGDGVIGWAESIAGRATAMTSVHRAGGEWVRTASPSSPLPGHACDPRVAMDRRGAALVVWAQSLAVDCSGSGPVAFATLAPGAAAWSAPQTIPGTAIEGPPVLHAHLDGPVVVAWLDAAGANVIRAAVGTVTDGLGAQQTVATLPTGAFAQYLTAATGAGGDAAVQWLRATSTTTTVETAYRRRGLAFSTPQPLSASPAGIHAVAVDPAGNVESVFPQAGVMRSRLLTASNGQWQLQQDVAPANAGYSPSVPGIAFDAAGTATIVWSEVDFSTPSPYLRRIRSAVRVAGVGSPWQPATLSGPFPGEFGLSLADDGAGTIVAAWVGQGTSGLEVRASVRPPGGAFGSETVVGLGQNRYAAVDAAGNALVGSIGPLSSARVAVYDATAPSIVAPSAPVALEVGQAGSFAAGVVDAWAGLAADSPVWAFGDGAAAVGATATHAYAAPGTFAPTLTATDAVGNATSAATAVNVHAPVPPPAEVARASLDGVRLRAAYRRSRLHGSVTARGATSHPATVLLRLLTRTPPQRILAQRRAALPGGSYAMALALPRALVPGRYVLRLSGTSLGAALPAVERPFRIPAPAEGVVARAFAHATPNGPAVLRLRGRRRILYATFVFASLPRRGPLTIRWLQPGERRETKPADKPLERRVTGTVATRVPGAALRQGVWRARLRARDVLVAEVAIRLG
jgi:hypothetical protein